MSDMDGDSDIDGDMERLLAEEMLKGAAEDVEEVVAMLAAQKPAPKPKRKWLRR